MINSRFVRVLIILLITFLSITQITHLISAPTKPLPQPPQSTPRSTSLNSNTQGKGKVIVVIPTTSVPKTPRFANIYTAILPALLQNTNVDKIIVTHGRAFPSLPDVVRLYSKSGNSSVVEVYDDSEYTEFYGPATRFLRCAKASSKTNFDYVIHIDDDQTPSPTAIDDLIHAIEFDKSRVIVGKYGRELSYNRKKYKYNTINTGGKTSVVLTKFMIHSTKLCNAFVDNMDRMNDFYDSGIGVSRWNGEDIFMSLLSVGLCRREGESGCHNYALPKLPVKALETKDGISGGLNYDVWSLREMVRSWGRYYGHLDGRLEVWREAVRVLGLEG